MIGNSLARTRVHISLSVSVSMCVTCARPVRPTKTATFGRGFTTEPTNSGLPSFCVTCLLRHFIMICGLRHVLSSNVAVRAWHCVYGKFPSPFARIFSQTKQAPKTVSVKWFARKQWGKGRSNIQCMILCS